MAWVDSRRRSQNCAQLTDFFSFKTVKIKKNIGKGEESTICKVLMFLEVDVYLFLTLALWSKPQKASSYSSSCIDPWYSGTTTSLSGNRAADGEEYVYLDLQKFILDSGCCICGMECRALEWIREFLHLLPYLSSSHSITYLNTGYTIFNIKSTDLTRYSNTVTVYIHAN